MKYILILLFTSLSLLSCKKSDNGKHPCYDESIVHNNACTHDCPGIIGCDGKNYCNECEAARVGIKPQ